MIIKICTTTGWNFIDKVDRVETIYTPDPKNDRSRLDKVIVIINNKTERETIECAENPHEVFLLNDEGKTIERIN